MIPIDVLIQVLLVVCAIPANGYVLLYAFRPFWVTPQGRALMVKAVGNAMLIDLGLSVVLWGDNYPLRPTIRLVAFTLFGVGIWYLFIALIRSDRDRRYPPASWIDRLRRREE